MVENVPRIIYEAQFRREKAGPGNFLFFLIWKGEKDIQFREGVRPRHKSKCYPGHDSVNDKSSSRITPSSLPKIMTMKREHRKATNSRGRPAPIYLQACTKERWILPFYLTEQRDLRNGINPFSLQPVRNQESVFRRSEISPSFCSLLCISYSSENSWRVNSETLSFPLPHALLSRTRWCER